MNKLKPYTQQTGAATLFITVIVMLVTLVAVLYTAKSTVTEIQSNANTERAKAAHANAQAGHDAAVNKLNVDDTATFSSLNESPLAPAGTTYFHVTTCASNITPGNLPTCPSSLGAFTCTKPGGDDQYAWVVSCGWSDDNSAVKRIISVLAKSQPLANPPNNPVTSRGAINVSGNATVVNYYNNLTYWSASSLSGASATGKTAIRNPNPAAPALVDENGKVDMDAVTAKVGNGNTLCANPQPTNSIICTTSSTSSAIGPDVISGDTSLSNLTPDDFFTNFMGSHPTEYRATVEKEKRFSSANIQSMEAAGIYWIDVPTGGTANFGSGTVIGKNGASSIVIVDGNLDIQGSPTFYGFIYVRGNIGGNGSPLIRGSMIVEGAVNMSGAPTIIFDKSQMNFSGGPYSETTSLPGTWRDY